MHARLSENPVPDGARTVVLVHGLMEEHLPLVRVPTLIVRGARDLLVSQDWTEEVQRLLPQSELIIVPGAAHAVNYNSPEKLASIVHNFLSHG